MADQPVMQGGIIAAGAGSRLRQAGWMVPKPLVEVAGVPLIGRVIGNFRAAGITSLVIIFNEEERDCENWVRLHYPDLDLRIIVKTTASSLESFREVCARLGSGPALISTVDAWCSEDDFVAFVRAARQRPADATVLAVTPLVADERPLWVAMGPDGRITGMGGDSGEMVTAGMYAVPERVRRLSSVSGLGRLREFLTRLVAQGEPVYGIVIPNVVDVDRAEDVALAEAMARQEAQEPGKPLGAVT
ncbi:MAG: NDP-sugar synthase [Nitrospiraceae bacterium]|nr:MAG: NDP-sugar synthase [Nitrospiraceae bacterium]